MNWRASENRLRIRPVFTALMRKSEQLLGDGRAAETFDDFFSEDARAFFDRGLVERQQVTLTHDYATVDDYCFHVRRFGGVHQIGIEIGRASCRERVYSSV